MARRQYTEEEKQRVDEARADWNRQCIAFMTAKTPFKDKTMKACLKRHGLEYNR